MRFWGLRKFPCVCFLNWIICVCNFDLFCWPNLPNSFWRKSISVPESFFPTFWSVQVLSASQLKQVQKVWVSEKKSVSLLSLAVRDSACLHVVSHPSWCFALSFGLSTNLDRVGPQNGGVRQIASRGTAYFFTGIYQKQKDKLDFFAGVRVL